jgi:hypothetical protein
MNDDSGCVECPALKNGAKRPALLVVISLEDAEELASAGLVHVGGFLERKTLELSNMSLLSPL